MTNVVDVKWATNVINRLPLSLESGVWRRSLSFGPESESRVGVWSPKFSNPGVGVSRLRGTLTLCIGLLLDCTLSQQYLLIWMSFRSKAILAAPSVVHLIRRIRFSPFIMKYTISMSHMTFWSWSRSPASLGPDSESESGVLNFPTPALESHRK